MHLLDSLGRDLGVLEEAVGRLEVRPVFVLIGQGMIRRRRHRRGHLHDSFERRPSPKSIPPNCCPLQSVAARSISVMGEPPVPNPRTPSFARTTIHFFRHYHAKRCKVVGKGEGQDHSLGLKADGSIIAWGSNYYGQTAVPEPNAGFSAVAASRWHSLGLKADGSVVAWGAYGPTNVPTPNTGFTAVATGWVHALGLKGDGSIVAWGCEEGYDNGQCDVPYPNTGFTAVAAGGFHSLGLKVDGSIVAWGSNFTGETTVPAPNTDFIAVAAGVYRSMGLKADGSIVEWGLTSIRFT